MDFINFNGLTIHYNWKDNRNGKTFLFINSLGTDFRIWDDVSNALNDYGDILLFDKRGHGLSGVVAETINLENFSRDVIGLLQYLSIKRCVPVGLSVGGMIAQILAHSNPEIVEKIVLCDTCYKIGNDEIWNERIATVKEKGLAAISEGVMEKWFSHKFRNEKPASVSGYRNMLERTPALGYIKTCEAIRNANLATEAKQIKLPTLCIVGSEDKSTTPEEVKELADLIEGSKYEVIEGSGHIPCVDNPEALSKLIIDFIK